MAKLKKAVNLDGMSVRSISGLWPEDITELRILGIGSVQALVDEMDRCQGDLTQLSTDAVVIESAQSDRIGDALLALGEAVLPEDFLEKFEISGAKNVKTTSVKKFEKKLVEDTKQPKEKRSLFSGFSEGFNKGKKK